MDKELQKLILEIIKVNNGQTERRYIFNKITRQYWKKEPSPETNTIIKHQIDLLEKDDKIIRNELKITREDGLGDTIYILTPSGHQEFDSFMKKSWRFILYDRHNVFVILSLLISAIALVISFFALYK
jgi:hypothetical protein